MAFSTDSAITIEHRIQPRAFSTSRLQWTLVRTVTILGHDVAERVAGFAVSGES